MPEQAIELSREVEDSIEAIGIMSGAMSNYLPGSKDRRLAYEQVLESLRYLARAIIAQVREENKAGPLGRNEGEGEIRS